MKRLIRYWCIVAAILVIGVGSSPLHAATRTVTNNADSGPGSLRQQITDAVSGDTINFAATVSTITLTSLLPVIAKTLTIDGTGQAITISGNNAFTVFSVGGSGDLTLKTLTVVHSLGTTGGIYIAAGGKLTATGLTCNGNRSVSGLGGGAIYNVGMANLTSSTILGNLADTGGGAILNFGTLTLASSTILGNSANAAGAILNFGMATLTSNTFSTNYAADGGAIYNLGTATLTSNTFSGNSAVNGGGAIYNVGTAALTSSTFSGNSAGTLGGAIMNVGAAATLTSNSSTFSGNSAVSGGGAILGEGMLTLTSNTFSGNSTDDEGGALYIVGTAALTSNTFSGNSAGTVGGAISGPGGLTLASSTCSGNSAVVRGGGIYRSGAPFDLKNSIVTGNTGADIDGPWTDQGNNLVGVDALLGPLADYGGPTQTMALLPGSPAIDAIGDGSCSSTDQRGFPRVGNCDIGSFESQGFTAGTLTGTPQATLIGTNFAVPLGITVTAINPAEPVSGGKVTFTGPASRAGISPASVTGGIDGTGKVSVIVAANGVQGAYTVTASANSIGGPYAYSLANVVPPVANAVSAAVAYNSVGNVIALNITGGTPTSVAVANAAGHGTATASGTGITYTPTPGYSGPDSFTYTATNGGGTSAPAPVTITVTPQPPVANAVSATVAYNSVGNVIALNITGGTPTSVAVASAAGHGTATAGGTGITYTPTPGYSGPDSFTYTATNAGGTSAPATVTITVNPQPPVANAVSATVAYGSVANPIALNITGGTPASVAVASAAGHGTATAGGTGITYTPAAGYYGPDSFAFTATNAGGTSAPATVTITVIGDSDNDSVPDPEERGPYGNNSGYDGNGDGIPDWQQSNVVSFHTSAQDGGSHYLTLALPSGQRFNNLYVNRHFDTRPPEWVSFPYGLFSFTISGLRAGGTATVTIYLDGKPPQTYYKYGKTPDIRQDHWYEFSYDGQTGAEVVGNTIVLHFVDGKRGDDDLEENGTITDPGGPAEIAPHEALYFPYLVSTDEEKTEIGIINPENYTSTYTITYYGENGNLVGVAAIPVGPKGKATLLSESIPQGSASAIVSGDGNASGYAKYVNAKGKRAAWPASTLLQKFLSIPHTAVDANWATALCIFNPTDEDVEVTMTYESGASSMFTLEARSRKLFWLGETEAVTSIRSTGYISAMEMFESLMAGGDISAILLTERNLSALYVPTIAFGSGEFTGIGLNSYYHGRVTIFGYSEDGKVEEISFGSQPLGAQSSRSRIAVNLSGILGAGSRWAKISGEADFVSAVGRPPLNFQGLAVYGKDNTEKLAAVNLNALRFKEGFLGILSPHPGTVIALLNPNTADAAVNVTGYNSAGDVLAGNTIRIAAGSNWVGVVSGLFNGVPLDPATHIKIASDVDLYGFETIYTDGRMEMLPVMGID